MSKQSNQRYRKELEKKDQNSYAETIRNAAKSNAENTMRQANSENSEMDRMDDLVD